MIINIPKQIRDDKKLQDYLANILCMGNVNTFDELDELDQDKLISLGMGALDGDIEFVVDPAYLAKYLNSYTNDSARDIADHLREQACEYFAPIFSQLIQDHLHERFVWQMEDFGVSHSVDQITGESIWL